ncbi:MAG: septum formation inhibitor Maf [Acidobacteria bacterium]|jgi:septum formation protein|nr:MAG: septum formation inhibitor Maf [Acidobacteriota bacterium]GIU81247.1 MAG: Maf-like protein [Pyrinomonadaceae bacterium]
MELLKLKKLPKLILASASPRRAEILKAVGWEFEQCIANVDETALPNEKPEDYVARLAKMKAEAVARNYDEAFILGADTTVVINGEIIGKPVDLDEARKMLKMLSGRWHEVLTAVALIEKRNGSKNLREGLQKTKVKFDEMSEEEIEFLVREGNPLDKAGAYAVQAQAALFIESIEGDYWNVVGLPINLVYKLVNRFNEHSVKKFR